MNPTAGSFTINPRLQRQFAVFAVSFPGMDALESIYKQIFTSHLEFNKFSGSFSNRYPLAPSILMGRPMSDRQLF